MRNQKNEQMLYNKFSDEEAASYPVPVITWDIILQYMPNIVQSSETFQHNVVVLKNFTPFHSEHMHTFFEMVYVLSESEIHMINQQTECFYTGDLYILPPAAQHSLPESNSHCISIMIQPDAFENIFSGILHSQDSLGDFLMGSLYHHNSETYLLFRTGKNEELRHIMMQMLDLTANADDYTDRMLTGMLVLLFTSLSRTHQDVIRTIPRNDRNTEILSLIYEQYNTITLAALAEKLHYTVPYCSKYLKNQLGCNFSELMKKIRFQKAEDFLLGSDMTVSQISQTLGYENPENFTRAFKHRYRMTPSQYRISQMSSCAEVPPPVKI